MLDLAIITFVAVVTVGAERLCLWHLDQLTPPLDPIWTQQNAQPTPPPATADCSTEAP